MEDWEPMDEDSEDYADIDPIAAESDYLDAIQEMIEDSSFTEMENNPFMAEATDYSNMLDVYCQMITERKFNRMAKNLKDSDGDRGIIELLFAIEKATGWHMEIMGSRSNVDDEMISKYNRFDPYAWEKVKNSDEWQDAIYKVAYISGRALDLAIQEIVQPMSREDKTRASIRRFLWSTWKALDLRFSK
jgi:hypothetical protein